jgi:hypothetical protein
MTGTSRLLELGNGASAPSFFMKNTAKAVPPNTQLCKLYAGRMSALQFSLCLCCLRSLWIIFFFRTYNEFSSFVNLVCLVVDKNLSIILATPPFSSVQKSTQNETFQMVANL